MSTYINDSNHPVTVRRWTILQDTFDEADVKWLMAFAIRVHVDRPTHTFDTGCGKQHTIAGKPRIEVTTTTDKQRDMLILKYGQSAVMLSQEYVNPFSTITHAYSKVKW